MPDFVIAFVQIYHLKDIVLFIQEHERYQISRPRSAKLDFTIKVRVLKKWNIPSRYNENEVWLTEMILMDEEVFFIIYINFPRIFIIL